ncbi:MAG: alpha-E domain-containing protein [Verrucomicrobiales bacterium]|nr:alpha-E domain-containing protein [Verrucomicrobiales bacterium]
MLSRVAENLYWMSRYIERADNLARLVTAHQNELLDATSSLTGDEHDWHPLLEVTSMGDEESEEGVVTYMVSSQKNPDSILNCVHNARENARAVRDQISEEMWLELNSLWLDLKGIKDTDPNRHQTICEMTMQSSLMFLGIAESSLPRTDIWAFVKLGSYIERADKTSRIVDLPHFLPQFEKDSAWNTMLRACSATAEHRHRFGGEVGSASASGLLLFSATFPRSVRYCVCQMDELLHRISGTNLGDYLNEAERETGALLARLNFAGVEEIGELGLHDYVDSIQTDLNEIGWAIAQRYFLLRKDAPPASAEEYVTSRMHAQHQQQQ